MIYMYLFVVGIVILFVVFGILDTINQARARKLLPEVLPRDWVDGRDLRKFLKTRGVSLSGPSFYSMMSGENAIIEVRVVPRIIDGEQISVCQYRRRLGAPIASSTVGISIVKGG